MVDIEVGVDAAGKKLLKDMGDGTHAEAILARAGGLGNMQVVPAGSTNGTPIVSTMPKGAVGARLYLGASDSVTFTIAAGAPSSAPSATVTVSGSATPLWDEGLSGGAMIYVTAVSGTPKFRIY